MKKRILAGFLCCLIFLTACSTKNDVNSDTVNIAMSELSGVFNPLMEVSAEDSYVNNFIFDKIIEFDMKGYPYGNICDYSANETNTVFTLKLKDVKFSDLTMLGAKDVLFTLKILSDPSYMGNYDISTYKIEGFDLFLNGKSQEISGIDILDEKTLSISLNEPNPYFIYGMSIPVLSENYYGKYYTYGNLEKLNENITPMGSGQYKFVNYVPNSNLELIKNENYFKGVPKISKVNIITTSAGAEMDNLITANCDLAYIPASVSEFEKIKSEKKLKTELVMENGYSSFGFNCKKPLLSDKRIRQALSYAINRQGIIKDIFKDYASVINIPQSKSSPYFRDYKIDEYSFNLDTANKILDELDYKKDVNGIRMKNGEKLSFNFVATTPNPLLEVALPVIKDDFSKIGVELKVETVDFNTFVDKLSNSDLDMWFFALGLTANPLETISLFETNSTQNYFSYSNKEFDEIYSKLNVTTDKKTQEKLYERAYQILNDELPLLPFYQRQQMLVYNERLKISEISPYKNCFVDFYKVGIK